MHEVHPLSLLVRNLEAHATLAAEDRQAIFDVSHQLRTVNPAAYLVREGEAPTNCAVLVEGYAFRHKLSGDGGRQIMSLNIPGEAVDFQSMFLDCADHNVQALTRATIAFIPRQAMIDLMRTHTAVLHAILMNVLVEASIFREWLLNIGRRNARTRLAHFLCEFATRLDRQGLSPEGLYQLPMTQEQLGDAVGLTSVHVNRSLRSLRMDGLISREGRAISFPDIHLLRAECDFSDLYLHLK